MSRFPLHSEHGLTGRKLRASEGRKAIRADALPVEIPAALPAQQLAPTQRASAAGTAVGPAFFRRRTDFKVQKPFLPKNEKFRLDKRRGIC